MNDYDEFLDLPEEPELAFVEFERRRRDDLWNEIRSEEVSNLSYVKDRKIYYVSKVMGCHDAFNFSFLKEPDLNRKYATFDDNFDVFIDSVTRLTTRLAISHASRRRGIVTILSIPQDIKLSIREKVEEIRKYLLDLDLRPEKKEALLERLNRFSIELDRDRTQAEALMALTIEIAATAGEAGKKLKPIKDVVDSITNLLGKVKEISERIGLPSPGKPKEIEGPRKQLPKPDENDSEEEIPF